MKRNIILFSAIILTLTAVSCSKSVKTTNFALSKGALPQAAYEYEEDAADFAPAQASFKSVSRQNSVANESFTQALPAEAPAPAPSEAERKLIKNGNFSIEVEDLASAEEKLEAWVKSLGGYVESSYMSERNGNLCVRIPQESFEKAMDAAGSFGRLLNKSVNTEDVTERFYDLKTRLDTKKIMRERLQNYLSSAKDIKDMLQIERELNSVIADIESMEGSLRRLSGQIDYSRINISFSLPFRSEEGQSFVLPSFKDSFRRFLSNVVDFFLGFIKIILYIVIFGVPVVSLIMLLYWLLFGKVGILRKIFKKISAPRKPKE